MPLRIPKKRVGRIPQQTNRVLSNSSTNLALRLTEQDHQRTDRLGWQEIRRYLLDTTNNFSHHRLRSNYAARNFHLFKEADTEGSMCFSLSLGQRYDSKRWVCRSYRI